MGRLVSTPSRRILVLSAAFACSCLAGCFDSTSTEANPKNQDEVASQSEKAKTIEAAEDRLASTAQVRVQPIGVRPSAQTNGGWLFLAIASTLAAIASTSLSAFLLFWRRRLPDGQISVLPEQVISKMDQLAVSNMKRSKEATALQDQALLKFSEVQKSFGIFAAVVAEKDKQIERLQNGGDKGVYLQFLKRFVRVLNLVDSDILEDQNDGKDVAALRSLRGYLADALLDAGLEEFSPLNGSDYRSAIGVADKPDVIETVDPDEDWNISSTLRPGFHVKTADQPIVIELARVEIFRFRSTGD